MSVSITIEGLEGYEARYLLKFADMLKAAGKKKEDVVRENGEHISLGRIPKYPETFENCGKIEEIIDNDPLY